MNKEIVGFTAGNFDLLHPGYIYTFEEAKRHCDRFLVFLQRDPSATRFTKYKPVIPYYERYKALMAIKYVDEVYMYQTEEELVDLIKFETRYSYTWRRLYWQELYRYRSSTKSYIYYSFA